MAFEAMDQKGLHPLPFVCEEIHFPTEKRSRFWKTESTQDCNEIGSEGISIMSIKRSDTSSLLEQHLLGVERMSSLSMTSRKVIDRDVRLQSDLNMMPLSQCAKGNRVDFNAPEYENSLFSSSFSDIFKFASHFEEDEPFESHEDIQVETIGNLLPDDDELLLGVIDELEYTARDNTGDDKDDFDLFNSIGGMELEADGDLSFSEGSKSSDFVGGIPSGQQVGSNGLIAGEHPYGEHPSRTLFVRNINSNVDDLELKALFEQYGDIRTLYTGCKHRGFVMISYYDIRAAHNAMKALQNKPLRRRKLDIHFSIPKGNPSDKDINHGTLVVFNLDSSVSNDELWQLFGVYGEIKEIRETPHKHHHKFIEFYDVRAAAAALHALNRSDIAGKQIKLEPSRPWGARRWLMQQFSPELEQEETGGSWQWGSPPNSSLQERSGSVPQELITSGCLDNGVIGGLHSTIRPSISPFAESPFHGISASVPHSLSSLTRPVSVGNHSNQSGFDGSRWSLDQMQFGFHRMPALHPHSFSEYHHDGLSNGVSTMEASINSRPIEGIDDRQIHRICSDGPNARSFEINGGVFGALKNENCPLHGHCHPWSNSHLHHHPPPPRPMMWPNSPPFVNGVHAHPQHQMHGLARAQSRILSTVAPLQHPNYYVGSAPAVNPSFWDKQQAYPPEHAEASDFHPGSLGNMGFSGSSALHLLELAPHNIFPHLGGKYIDPSISASNIGFPLPHQRSHVFPSRNPMIPMSTSFDSPHERIRARRNGANSSQADIKKQYELDISCILRGEDTRTTLMIKNIPNKYTSKMLMATIDEHHQGAYDFIYLPIDFKNKCNVGYAFINLIDPMKIVSFYQALNGKKWEKFNSEKVASLAYARIQGKAALIAHFQNSSLMNEDKRCRPILFHTDGPNAGNQEPFPVGPNIRSRPGRTRTNSDENHQGSSAVSISGDESSSGTDSSGSSNGIE